MKTAALYFISVLFLCSCSEKGNQSNENPDNLVLTKVDSIQVPYLGLLNLMDVHPESGKVLLFNQRASLLILGDFDGNEPQELTLSGDAPENYGSFPLGAGKFSEDGKSFTILSNKGVYTYDLKGNLINGGKHRIDDSPSFNSSASANMEFYWVDDKILTIGTNWGDHPRNTTEFYEEYVSLAWFDTLERNIERFMHLDETSFFRNGKAHDIAFLTPKMAADEEQLYFIQGIEPALNIHSIHEPNEKINRIPLQIADYNFNQGQDFAEVNPRVIDPDIFSGNFENLKVTDEYILVSFFSGVPELDQDKYENMGWQELLPKLAVDYPKRMLVLDKEGNKLKEIIIPAEFNTRQWLVRDGYLWFLATVNLEEEEDFVKIYKVKLGEG